MYLVFHILSSCILKYKNTIRYNAWEYTIWDCIMLCIQYTVKIEQLRQINILCVLLVKCVFIIHKTEMAKKCMFMY